MTFRHIIYIMATALLAGVAATSCAGTDAEPQYPGGDFGDPLTLNLTLSASPLGSAVSRSGWDKEKNPEKSNEKINSWIVAIAKDGKITAVVKGLPSSPTDQASVGIELIKGEYTAIAFANMDIGKLGSLLTVGADITGWDSLSLSELAAKAGVDNLFDTPVHGNDLIPMSAIKDISVPVKDEKGLTIELTRMFCKVEFTFKNDSNDNITISKISLKPTYSGDICLFPRKEDDGSPKIPGTGTGKHEEDLTHPLAPGGVTTRDDRPHFYIKETLAGSHPTGRFHIGISLTRGDSSEEEATYALAADALKWISRNDYVLFPIVITDYVPEIEVYDYPPIGGYPVQVESRGNEFYATFSSSGEFDICARLRDSQGRIVNILPPDHVELTECDKNIKLTYDPALGMWHGWFNKSNGNPGTYIFKFEFGIGDLTYHRTVYLIG